MDMDILLDSLKFLLMCCIAEKLLNYNKLLLPVNHFSLQVQLGSHRVQPHARVLFCTGLNISGNILNVFYLQVARSPEDPCAMGTE